LPCRSLVVVIAVLRSRREPMSSVSAAGLHSLTTLGFN
jgi:hypothetical protein